MLNLMETRIPEMFSVGIDAEKDLTIGASHVSKIATVLFEAVSACLRDIKSKDYPVAFVFDNLVGDVIAAAVIEYHQNEDSTQPGNWSYVWGFGNSHIPETAKIVKITDTQAQHYFVSISGSRFNMGYEKPGDIVEINNYFLKILEKYLHENADKGDDGSVTLDGVFQARTGIENGEVVKSIEVIGEVKAIVKGDGDIEVK